MSWVAPNNGDSAITRYEYVKKSGTDSFETIWTTIPNSASLNSYTVTGLISTTSYKFKVRAVNSSGNGAESPESDSVVPGSASLSGSAVEATTATLTIANHAGSWYHKKTAPTPAGSCSTVVAAGTMTVSLTGLSEGTSYTYKAYSDGSCNTELTSEATDAEFLTKPAQVSDLGVTALNSSLEVNWIAVTSATGYKVQWKSGSEEYNTDDRQTTVSSGTSTTITGLVNGTDYTIRVIATNGTGDGAASVEVSGRPAPLITLSGSAIETTTATLSIANHVGSWYYKKTAPATPAGSCSTIVTAGTTTVSLTGLIAGTRYTYRAYSDSSCNTDMTTGATNADFLTKPAQVSGVSVTSGNTALDVSWTAAAGTVTGYKVQWKASNENYTGARQKTVSSGTTTTITGLTNATAYTVRVRAYNATGDGATSTEATGTPSAPAAVSLSGSGVEATTATLTIANYSGAWYYKYTVPSGDTSCTKIDSGTTTASLTGLDEGTSYTYKAYSDSNCASELDSADLLTKPGKVAGVSATVGNASLDVSWTVATGARSYKIQWKSGTQEWDATNRQATSTTASKTLTTLVNGTAYTIRVAAVNATGDGTWSDEATGTPAAPDLWVENIGYHTANLWLRNWTGGRWSYKVVGQRAARCYKPSASTYAVLDGLAPDTDYTITAHSGLDCVSANLLDTETFTTRASDWKYPVLSVSNVGNTGATLTMANHTGAWWYAETADYTTCTKVDTGTSSVTLSGLSPNKYYHYVAFSGAGCINSATPLDWFTLPADFTTTGTTTVTVTDQTATSVQLSVSGVTSAKWSTNHLVTGDPYYRYSQCQTYDQSTSSATVTGLTAGTAYTFYMYSGDSCIFLNNRIAAQAHTVQLSVGSVGATTATLQLNHYDGNWWHQEEVGSAAGPAGAGKISSGAACTPAGTGSTANLSNLTPGTQYTYTAYNGPGCNNDAHLAQASFTTQFATAPDPVAAVTVDHQGSSLAVSWDAPARATHYHVTYSGDSGTSWQLAVLEHSGTSLAITGVDSSKTYIVGVRAKNAGGYSDWVNSAPAAPPALSVADATAAEPNAGQSANLDFVVTLNRAATGAVSVDYATSAGTATAGADYTTASGTLTFQPGETSKTVSVAVLNDSHDDGGETLTLTLSNATGAVIDDGEATGTITNADPIPQAWISRFGRTVADQVLDAVDTRMGREPTPGLAVTVAGERLDWWADGDGSDEEQPVAQQAVEQLAQWLVVGNGDNGDLAVRTVDGRALLSDSSFDLSSRRAGGALLSFWGRGAVTSFQGQQGELSLDGEVTTWMVGTDWSWGQPPDSEVSRTTAGLLLSRSTAAGSYDGADSGTANGSSGDVATTLTGVFPWGRHRLNDRLEAWGTAGYGQGELQVTPKQPTGEDDATTLTANLNLWLAAGGLRGTLLDGGSDGLTLTGTTDAMVVGTSSGSGSGADGGTLDAAQATVTRLRLGLEAQRPFHLGNPASDSAATLTPSLEMGLRHDSGDAETGFGLDLGGGILLSHPRWGLEAELRGRGLLSHAADGFRDQGFSASLSWQQHPDSALGAALSLTQTMGGSPSGGADALLSTVTLEGLANNNSDDNLSQRMELQLSYGFLAFGDRFTLSPELGLGLYDSGRDYRIGWNLTRPADGEQFAFSFDVTRRESTNNNGIAPEHGVKLEWNTQF